MCFKTGARQEKESLPRQITSPIKRKTKSIKNSLLNDDDAVMAGQWAIDSNSSSYCKTKNSNF